MACVCWWQIKDSEGRIFSDGCLRLFAFQPRTRRRTISRAPISLPGGVGALSSSVIDRTCRYSEGGKNRSATVCVYRSELLPLSPSADLNYTSFYQAGRGSSPAAALFIKCNVQIHTSKLMRGGRAVNQTPRVPELISCDGHHKLCPLEKKKKKKLGEKKNYFHIAG